MQEGTLRWLINNLWNIPNCTSIHAQRHEMSVMSEFLFFFFQLIQTNKLKHYPSIHGDFSNDFKQPCVVFTGHPSLRFGDVVHFMELWGKSSLNTVIFTGKWNAVIIIELAIGCTLWWTSQILGALLICSGAEVSDFGRNSFKLRPQDWVQWRMWLLCHLIHFSPAEPTFAMQSQSLPFLRKVFVVHSGKMPTGN